MQRSFHFMFGDCEKSNFCNRKLHDAFLKKPFCPEDLTSTPNSEQDLFKKCGEVNLTLAQSYCNYNADLLVTKLTRLENLQQLEPIITGFPNTYILYIVRDPRGIVKSRLDISKHMNKPTTYLKNEHDLEGLCDRMKQNILYINQKISENSIVKDRISVLRFEDFVMNPVGSVKSVVDKFRYSSPGLETGLSWFQNNTYSNITENIFSWRKVLERKHIQKIEESCGGLVMKSFGYKTVGGFTSQDIEKTFPLERRFGLMGF